MNKRILLSLAIILTSFGIQAQTTDRAYILTGKTNNPFLWTDIKEVDITTGETISTIFESDKTAFTISNLNKSDTTVSKFKNPTGYGTAACALDTRYNRLFFSPLHFSDISYLDLSSAQPAFVVVKRNVIPMPPNGALQTEENQITKMVIAADNFGYALTNDCNHFFRFTTDKNSVVVDLGPLLDAASNKGISIHNKITGWGGDIVADAFGNLIVISANHYVFSIDVHSKTATCLGEIKGLPAKFTTNGAAVNTNGDLIVASANVIEGIYKVNVDSLTATKIVSSFTPFNASDMANANFLSQNKYDALSQGKIFKNIPVLNNSVSVFPNPVSGNSFKLSLSGNFEGIYQVALTDASGNVLQISEISLKKGINVQQILLNTKYTAGNYFIEILNTSRQSVGTQKIVIQ